MTQTTPARARTLAPLYAAGFVTAFGAHGIAANLGGYTHTQHASLLVLGVLLAVYNGAEVVLKPVFGGLADRVGPRPVLLGGLITARPGHADGRGRPVSLAEATPRNPNRSHTTGQPGPDWTPRQSGPGIPLSSAERSHP